MYSIYLHIYIYICLLCLLWLTHSATRFDTSLCELSYLGYGFQAYALMVGNGTQTAGNQTSDHTLGGGHSQSGLL